jgi:cephalosporin hydroxylase
VNSDRDADFAKMRRDQIKQMGEDEPLRKLTHQWFQRATEHGYSYHFEALGAPIIQFPQDIVAVNEIIWSVRPDVIIETGIARGGSVVNSASQLALLDLSECQLGTPFVPRRKVIAIDVDIREFNKEALEKHFLTPWFELIEGSSTSCNVVQEVTSRIPNDSAVLVLLDSNHTHDHVVAELRAYAPFVTPGSYCVVFDTVIQQMPQGYFHDRPWDVGNNPATAVHEFLMGCHDFVVDQAISDKLLVSAAPGGYLKRLPEAAS